MLCDRGSSITNCITCMSLCFLAGLGFQFAQLAQRYCQRNANHVLQALWSVLENGRRGSSELLALAEDHVRAASWQELMQPLLPLLPEEALLRCCTHALPVNTYGKGLFCPLRAHHVYHLPWI